MGKSKPGAEREGTPSDETAPTSDRVLRPRPLFGFATSRAVRKNASNQQSNEITTADRAAAVQEMQAAPKRKTKNKANPSRQARTARRRHFAKAIPDFNERQKFYDEHKQRDQATLDRYLEEQRLLENALRIMAEYCTGEGSDTRSHVGEEFGGAPVVKSWFHGRSRFAESVPLPLREWELD